MLLLKQLNKIESKEQIISIIDNAKTPEDLKVPARALAVKKKTYDKRKEELKQIVDSLQQPLKEWEKEITSMEKLIKDKFLNVYQEAEVLIQKKQFNPDTQTWESTEDGELKLKKVNNKGQKTFTYTAEKKEIVKDLSNVSYETHPHLYDLKPVLNEGYVRLDQNLPTKEIIIPAKVGIQFANLQNEVENMIKLEAEEKARLESEVENESKN